MPDGFTQSGRKLAGEKIYISVLSKSEIGGPSDRPVKHLLSLASELWLAQLGCLQERAGVCSDVPCVLVLVLGCPSEEKRAHFAPKFFSGALGVAQAVRVGAEVHLDIPTNPK
jgi:hypothetical protein